MRAPIQHAGTRSGFVFWDNLGASEPHGDWAGISDWPYKTVLIEGGQATLYGRMHADDPEGVELIDAYGLPIKGPGFSYVTMNPLWIRPVLIAGEHVRVSIVGSRGGF